MARPRRDRRVLREARERTDAPFAANLVLDEAAKEVPIDDHVEAVLGTDVDVVSLSFGDPAPYVDRIHQAEAGGHVDSEVATMALVPRVADAVDVPVVAAGGIADGRGIALALGAGGAWLGTRFVACEEANVHRTYRRRLREGIETGTRYTEAFDKGWPGTLHRVLENDTLDRWTAAGEPGPGDRPAEDAVVARIDSEPIERYDEALATPGVSGDIEAMALYAGRGVGLIEAVPPAGRVVDGLVGETREAIDRTAATT